MNNEFVMGQYEDNTNNKFIFLKKKMKIFIFLGIVILIILGFIVYKTTAQPHYSYYINQIEAKTLPMGEEGAIEITVSGDTKNEENLVVDSYIVEADVVELIESKFEGKAGSITYKTIAPGTESIYILAYIVDRDTGAQTTVAEIEVPVTVY